METDWGQQAQAAAEKRLAYCNALEWDSDDMEGIEVSEPCAPYCGCDTCVVREILDAAWPFLLQAAKEELAGNVVSVDFGRV